MTVEEIFSTVSTHMVEGLMIHEQLANYYDFLGFKGFKRCHEYHYIEESWNFRIWERYFINHFNKLIPEREVKNPKVIPNAWFSYIRQQVDNTTKKNAIKTGVSKWVDWEKETKTLYQQMHHELCELGEVAAAMKLDRFICCVDKELKKAERVALDLKSEDYDLGEIYLGQCKIHDHYKKKLEKFKYKLC